MGPFWIAAIAAVIAILFAFYMAKLVTSKDAGNETMRQIMGYIQEGAMAFLGREYKSISIFIIVVVILLLIGLTAQLGFGMALATAIAYLVGASLSLTAGYFGMKIATSSNARTAAAAKDKGFTEALAVGTGAFGCIEREERAADPEVGHAGPGLSPPGKKQTQMIVNACHGSHC